MGSIEHGKKVLLSIMGNITSKNNVSKWGECEWEPAIESEITSIMYGGSGLLDEGLEAIDSLIEFMVSDLDDEGWTYEHLVAYGMATTIAIYIQCAIDSGMTWRDISLVEKALA